MWDTLVAAKRCDWHPMCSAMAYVIWAYKRFPECSPTHKKAGVCAVMSMWLVHIKEYMWSVRTCPTTILLSAVRECVSAALKGWMIEVLPHMRWQACMLPRELTWEEVASPQEKWNDTVWKAFYFCFFLIHKHFESITKMYSVFIYMQCFL